MTFLQKKGAHREFARCNIRCQGKLFKKPLYSASAGTVPSIGVRPLLAVALSGGGGGSSFLAAAGRLAADVILVQLESTLAGGSTAGRPPPRPTRRHPSAAASLGRACRATVRQPPSICPRCPHLSSVLRLQDHTSGLGGALTGTFKILRGLRRMLNPTGIIEGHPTQVGADL